MNVARRKNMMSMNGMISRRGRVLARGEGRRAMARRGLKGGFDHGGLVPVLRGEELQAGHRRLQAAAGLLQTGR